MIIMKRNGSEEQFNVDKIISAISRANAVDNKYEMSDEEIHSIADDIQSECLKLKGIPTVEDIQDMVESRLMNSGNYNLAKRYITYRYTHSLIRQGNSTDEKILSLIECNNEEAKQENSNKDPVINSVQRDYMAGEVSRDITRRLLLPEHIVKAHEDGIIHFHDMDYYAQHMHNCFSSKTKFVTDAGVLEFGKFKDGEDVTVLDKDGCWRKAVVHKYEMQKLYDITLSLRQTFKTITCTRDHRWILKDGTVTTNLSEGDVLYPLKNMISDIPQTKRECEMFALGMIIGNGCDESSSFGNGVHIRLCGNKVKYADVFKKCGYSLYKTDETDEITAYSARWKKQRFLDAEGWKYLNSKDKQMLFLGYYAAGGCKDRNMCHTSDVRVAAMIEEISAICGYHIVDKKYISHDTSYKKDAELYQFSFIRQQHFNKCWKVEKIKEHRKGNILQETWCVEEPVTHSFTLDGGIVTGNCCLINLEDMLQNGTVISETLIEKPHMFSTACNIITQIIAQVASNQYGGQSITFSHLAPFVDISRQKFRKAVREEFETAGLKFEDEKVNKIAEIRVKEDVKRGVQIIQYQIITLMTTNGQAPFVTMFMYLNEVPEGRLRDDLALIIKEVLKQRILGIKNEKGVYITQAFPKLIYVLEENNITEDSEYWYLTKLSAECTAKRMVPDYISEKKMLEYKIDKNGNGNCYPCMGCRSFLTPYLNENGEPKYYGRFNQGVVTINLVDVACSSKQDMNKFWKILDERLELCHEALMCRHNRLLETKSDAAPILWQHGALARLEKDEKIDKLLFGGYSTISLGYVGLYECTRYMTGKSHTDSEAMPFALEVMQRLNDACNHWKEMHNIDFSLYGTPIESTTYRFAKCLKKRFGIIEGVTDKNYITNSYHVHVTEEIDAFTKLSIEAKFQKLSPGGAVSYVEVPNMQNNIEAVLAVMKHIYENNIYAELNTKSDYCQECGFNGEIQIIENDDGKLIWECPHCGNRDQDRMNVARRTCGYIGTQYWNQGRTQEIKERVLHL